MGCELVEPGIGSNTLRTDHASYPGSQAGRPCGLKVSGVGVAQIRCRNLGRQGFEFGSTCRPQICMYVYTYIYMYVLSIYLSSFMYITEDSGLVGQDEGFRTCECPRSAKALNLLDPKVSVAMSSTAYQDATGYRHRPALQIIKDCCRF